MSKLVDRERLARLAQALDSRMKDAVAAEKDRAMGVEGGLQQAINNINDVNNGILKQAKDYADGKDSAIQAAQNAADAAQEDANQNAADIAAMKDAQNGIEAKAKAYADQLKGQCDQAMENHVAAQAEIDEAQDQRLADLEEMMGIGGEGQQGSALDKIREDVAQNAGDITALKGRMDAVETKANDNADAIAKEVEDRQEAVQGLDTRVKAIEENMADDIAEAVQALKTTHDSEMDAVEGRVADLEAKFSGDQSVDAKIQAAKDYADQKDQALEGRVNAKFDTVNGEIEDHEGRIAANEAFVAAQPGKDDANLQTAKDYADQKIAALVNSAPEDLNTLNELAQAIKDHGDEYEAYITTVNGQIATAKSEAIAEAQSKDEALESRVNQKIADDVKAEADRAKEVEQGLQNAINTINNAENGILAQAKADAASKVAAEESRAKGVEQELQNAINALSGEQGAEAKAKAYTDQEIAKAKSEMSAEIDADVKAEADRAKGEEARIEGKVDAISGRLDNEGGLVDRIEANEAFVANHSHEGLQGEIDAVEGRVDALEAFKNGHDHSVMEQGIADNKAAIEKEVQDRDAAIAEALKDYTDTDAMKAMLGNVVNSLGIKMEDNKLKLTLGGGNSEVTLKEVSLDMATDADIDAIIAGLDA